MMDTKLSNPGAVISALPALLGFTPQRSLVVIPLAQKEIICAMRVDLPPTVEQLPFTTLAAHAARAGADSVIVVVVDENGAHCQMCADDYEKIVQSLGVALVEYQIPIHGAYVVDVIDSSGRWHSVDGADAGAVPDPRTSAVMAGAVMSGRCMYATRDALAATLAPTRARPSLARHIGNVGPISDSDGVTAVVNMLGASALSTKQLARLAVITANLASRDAVLKFANDDSYSADVERLFTQASRALVGTHRANALAVVAFFAYARGDGALAGIAIDDALRLAPSHTLATLLDTALRRAVPPQRIRALVSA